jgi:hypothetical protein
MQDLAGMDLNDMNFAALSALRERIEEKVREMREVGGPALLAKLAEEAAEIGMSVEEVVALGGKRRGRPPKARDGVDD